MSTNLNLSPENTPLPADWCNLDLAGRPHLFSNCRVWVSPDDLTTMSESISAIECVLHDPRYQAQTIQQGIAVPGVLFGYDFHLCESGPKLIEINTNAGGAFLNVSLGEAWKNHVQDGRSYAPDKDALLSMFQTEWQQAGLGNVPPGLLVIVDEKPAEQYLYPEFELCRDWLAAAGWRTVIADPAELIWDGEKLCLSGQRVSMVYNRLTDFQLTDVAHAALKSAYLAQAVVVTPHPQAHAMMADKGHLVKLADGDFLASLGIAPEIQERIARVLPACQRVQAADAEALWQNRKKGFFKPVAGFGSRAAYRGDKLTKRVFEEILAGDYIVQALVPPSERVVDVEGVPQSLKLDIRNYTYQGKVLGVVARLYQGQTTNFRTQGGGFAPVYCAPL